jgi:ComF family protein
LLRHLLNFVYPPICLACHALLPQGEETLCLHCLEQLELIDPSDRCSHCFGPAMEPLCRDCRRHRSPLQVAAAFVYDETASVLVKNLKFGGRVDLAPALAGYMAIQLERLMWTKPDLLVPVPMYWMRQLHRGYNQSYLLAIELQRLWGGSVRSVLARKGGESCQGGLNFRQRKALASSSFQVRSECVQDRTIYLIDDVATTGSTLIACAEALLCAGAREVRALTVCRAGL